MIDAEESQLSVLQERCKSITRRLVILKQKKKSLVFDSEPLLSNKVIKHSSDQCPNQTDTVQYTFKVPQKRFVGDSNYLQKRNET
jgi:hypothetical protein